MYFTIYKITNVKTSKIYIGKHQTLDLDDGYLGSGIAISNAIRKHGTGNFRKEIMFIFDNERDMEQKEKELVTEKFVASKLTYNQAVGGQGGAMFKGKQHTAETKNKIRQKLLGHTGAVITDEIKEKIAKTRREKNDGEFFDVETKQKISNSLKGFKRSEENRKRIREGRLRYIAQQKLLRDSSSGSSLAS
jgi:hypothetical protein